MLVGSDSLGCRKASLQALEISSSTKARFIFDSSFHATTTRSAPSPRELHRIKPRWAAIGRQNPREARGLPGVFTASHLVRLLRGAAAADQREAGERDA